MNDKTPKFYKIAESNSFLERMKTIALSKIDTKPKYLAICRQRDLGVCLIALGRTAEAVEVLQFAQEGISFKSGIDAWDSASHAAALVAHVRSGEAGYSPKNDLQRFIDQPANALFTQAKIYTSAGIISHLERERARFSMQFNNPKPDAAIEAMCWWASTLNFYRKFAKLGYPNDGELDTQRLERDLHEILDLLRQKLESLAAYTPTRAKKN